MTVSYAEKVSCSFLIRGFISSCTLCATRKLALSYHTEIQIHFNYSACAVDGSYWKYFRTCRCK